MPAGTASRAAVARAIRFSFRAAARSLPIASPPAVLTRILPTIHLTRRTPTRSGRRPPSRPPRCAAPMGRATAVWVFICGSTPTTIMTVPFRRVQTVGVVGGHALAGAYWPGSYQVTTATSRYPAAGDITADGQPLKVTEALWVTTPPDPRLPDLGQASHTGRVTLTKRWFRLQRSDSSEGSNGCDGEHRHESEQFDEIDGPERREDAQGDRLGRESQRGPGDPYCPLGGHQDRKPEGRSHQSMRCASPASCGERHDDDYEWRELEERNHCHCQGRRGGLEDEHQRQDEPEQSRRPSWWNSLRRAHLHHLHFVAA